MPGTAILVLVPPPIIEYAHNTAETQYIVSNVLQFHEAMIQNSQLRKILYCILYFNVLYFLIKQVQT